MLNFDFLRFLFMHFAKSNALVQRLRKKTLFSKANQKLASFPVPPHSTLCQNKFTLLLKVLHNTDSYFFSLHSFSHSFIYSKVFQESLTLRLSNSINKQHIKEELQLRININKWR